MSSWSSKFETCSIYLTFWVILIKNILTLTRSGTKTCTQKHTKLAKNSNIFSFGLFCTKLRSQTHRKSMGIIKKTNVWFVCSTAIIARSSNCIIELIEATQAKMRKNKRTKVVGCRILGNEKGTDNMSWEDQKSKTSMT